VLCSFKTPLFQFRIKAPLDGTRIDSSLDSADGLFTASLPPPLIWNRNIFLNTGKQKTYGENHFVGKGQLQTAD